MCSSQIVCPVCEEAILRKITIAGRERDNTEGTQTADIRSFHICFSCRMTFFEENLLEKKSLRRV